MAGPWGLSLIRPRLSHKLRSIVNIISIRSKMILNYWMMMERYPNVNPKVIWRTKFVFDYFQSKFKGICQIVLEKFNKE